MITIEQYFSHKINHLDATEERKENARKLLEVVNALLEEAKISGIKIENDPDTKCQISGAKDGQGDGGFRLSLATTGRPGSSHKEGRGVDVYDKGNRLDEWITRDILKKYNLYREAPPFTEGWCHLTDRAPRSGCRSFIP